MGSGAQNVDDSRRWRCQSFPFFQDFEEKTQPILNFAGAAEALNARPGGVSDLVLKKRKGSFRCSCICQIPELLLFLRVKKASDPSDPAPALSKALISPLSKACSFCLIPFLLQALPKLRSKLAPRWFPFSALARTTWFALISHFRVVFPLFSLLFISRFTV